MTVLALDYGEKRIGVAVTDESGKFSKPLEYIPNKSELKKVDSKSLPQGTTIEQVQNLKKQYKQESNMEFRKVCNKLLYLINCYYPEKILIGLPTVVNEDGSIGEGQQAKKVRKFGKELQHCFKTNNISITLEYIEESMSSSMAEERLRSLGITTTEKIRERIDSTAAAILLETYLHTNL